MDLLVKKGLIALSIAFLLNVVWESIHAPLLYEGFHNISLLSFEKRMLYVSAGDMLLIGLIFCIGALAWRKRWLHPFERKQVAFVMLAGLILAIMIELRAFAEGKWNYTPLMPTVFGIGLSPLVELAITSLLSFYSAAKITK